MTEREKLRLELLELQVASLFWERSFAPYKGYIGEDQEKRNKRIENLKHLIVEWKG